MKEITFNINFRAAIICTPSGYLLGSGQFRKRVKHSQPVRLVNQATSEQLMLSEFIDGSRFAEFDPMTIFGTTTPEGSKIQDWLCSLWGSKLVYPAMSWVSATVPLDVLLGLYGPRPGVTIDERTGWHWSAELRATKNPEIYGTMKEFKNRK